MESVFDERGEDLDGLDVLDAGVGDEDGVKFGVLDLVESRSPVLDVGDDRLLLETGEDVSKGRRMFRAPVEADDENRGSVVDLTNISRLGKYRE